MTETEPAPESLTAMQDRVNAALAATPETLAAELDAAEPATEPVLPEYEDPTTPWPTPPSDPAPVVGDEPGVGAVVQSGRMTAPRFTRQPNGLWSIDGPHGIIAWNSLVSGWGPLTLVSPPTPDAPPAPAPGEDRPTRTLAEALGSLEQAGAVIRPMAVVRNKPGLVLPLDTFLERLVRDLADAEAAVQDQRDDQGWVDADLERATEGHRALLGRYLVNAALALLET